MFFDRGGDSLDHTMKSAFWMSNIPIINIREKLFVKCPSLPRNRGWYERGCQRLLRGIVNSIHRLTGYRSWSGPIIESIRIPPRLTIKLTLAFLCLAPAPGWFASSGSCHGERPARIDVKRQNYRSWTSWIGDCRPWPAEDYNLKGLND